MGLEATQRPLSAAGSADIEYRAHHKELISNYLILYSIHETTKDAILLQTFQSSEKINKKKVTKN